MVDKPSIPEQKPIAAAVSAAVQEVRPEPTPEPQPERADHKDDAPLREAHNDPMANPRNRVMAEIAERRAAELNAEAGQPAPEKDAASEEAPAEAVKEPPAKPAEPQPQAPDAQVLLQPVTGRNQPPQASPEGPLDPNAEYELIVEGRPVKFKGSQIIDFGRRGLQKETAAEYKLEQASRILAEAQRRAAETLPLQGGPQPAQQPNQGKSDADLASAVQFGTPEEASQAIAELRRRDPAVSMDQIVANLRKELPTIIRNETEFARAHSMLLTDYGDIFNDPYIRPVFLQEEKRLRQAGDVRSHSDLYKAIGDHLRTHFNRPTPQAVQTTETRLEAKRRAPPAPKLAASRIEGGNEQELDPKQKRAMVIEKMRQRTGKGVGKDF